MNTIMPRFGYDLRQPDLPPRWDVLADSSQSIPAHLDVGRSGGKNLVGSAGRFLTLAVLLLITLVFVFLAGAGLGIW